MDKDIDRGVLSKSELTWFCWWWLAPSEELEDDPFGVPASPSPY